MISVTDAWSAIRDDHVSASGWNVRRLNPGGRIKLLAALSMPTDKPALLLEVSATNIAPGTTYPKCIGFVVRPEMVSSGSSGTVRIYLEQGDERFTDLFAILCQDIADHARTAPSESAAFRIVLGRLHTWQRFVTEHGLNRLSEEKQIGLFAELLFLGERLLPKMTALDAFRSWRGPFGEAHDFELPEISVEIKATGVASPTVIRISNLDQLEPTGNKALFLATMQILEDNETGRTLPDLIRSTRNMIAAVDSAVTLEFDAALMEVGYIETHASSYGIRRRCFRRRDYRVGDGFPRLVRNNVPPGIADASYTIRIDSCMPHEAEPDFQPARTGAGANE